MDNMKKAIKYNSHNAYYWSVLGLIYDRMDSIEISSENPIIYKKYSRNNGNNEAKIAFEKASKLNKRDDVFMHNLAWLEFYDGNIIRAIDYITKAKENDSSSAINYLSAGLFYESTKSIDKVLENISHSIILEPSIIDSKVLKNFEKRNYDIYNNAIKIATLFLEKEMLYENDPIIAAKLGKLYIKQGKNNSALNNLCYALKILPNINRAWVNMSHIYFNYGNFNMAQKYLTRARMLNSNDLVYLREVCLQSLTKEYDNMICKSMNDNVKMMQSLHSQKVSRIYHIENVIVDDIIPRGLLKSMAPIEISNN